MPDTDELVLRVLSQAGIGVSPGGIAANIDAFTEATATETDVRVVIDDLEDQNYVRQLDDTDYYRITDHGRDDVRSEFGDDVFGYID